MGGGGIVGVRGEKGRRRHRTRARNGTGIFPTPASFEQSFKGYLAPRHYNFPTFEKRHYNSAYWKSAITILIPPRPCPVLRLARSWAHLQSPYSRISPYCPLFSRIRQRLSSPFLSLRRTLTYALSAAIGGVGGDWRRRRRLETTERNPNHWCACTEGDGGALMATSPSFAARRRTGAAAMEDGATRYLKLLICLCVVIIAGD